MACACKGEAMTTLASKSQLRASFIRWALFCVPLVMLVGFLGGQLGSPNSVWFANLAKPAIFPPPAVFGIVWTVLFTMIGFALAIVMSAWGAYGRGWAVILFIPHFVISTSWSAVFFGWQNMSAGLIILALAVATLVPVLYAFWRVRQTAALLLLPYFGWLSFASALNYQFIVENPDGGVMEQSGAVVEVPL
jgi:tryptophan-rich sensory protein